MTTFTVASRVIVLPREAKAPPALSSGAQKIARNQSSLFRADLSTCPTPFPLQLDVVDRLTGAAFLQSIEDKNGGREESPPRDSVGRDIGSARASGAAMGGEVRLAFP